jgi:hypothetical protein
MAVHSHGVRLSLDFEATLPGGVAPEELSEYLRALIDRLARLAHP